MKKVKYIFLMALAVSFTACDINNDLDEIPAEVVVLEDPNPGVADFSNYVSIGASFTAGFSDNAMFVAAQSQSFPAIMARQMASMGGGDFTQPMVNDNVGGLLLFGQPIAGTRFFFNGAGPTPLPGTPTTEVSNILSGPFNNYGVPGAKSFHMVAPGYGNIANIALGAANPYFVRMASSPNATVLGDAAAQAPTFFTISDLGGNDVLVYAITGGTGVVQTGNPDPSTYASNDITDPGVLAQAFGLMIQTLTANGAKGLVTTVPSIVNLPFFTTVPHNAIPLDQATADLLNGGFAAYNGGLQLVYGQLVQLGAIDQATANAEIAQRTINFAAGQNAVTIVDEDLRDLTGFGLPNFRQATEDDLLVLTSSSFLGTVAGGNPTQINGLSVPLEDRWVLTPQEQDNIQIATNAYNAAIINISTANGLVVVDLDAALTELSTTGLQFDEFTMTSSLVFGGFFSLDGIHPTTRGYALMAKLYLQALDDVNTGYGSNFRASGNVPKANNYPTNYPPGI